MDWNSIAYETLNGYSLPKVACDACRGKLVLASDEVKAQRRAICAECEFKNRYGFCRKCGCKVSWKTAVLKAACPLKKWLSGN